jgi:hypothetical protein
MDETFRVEQTGKGSKRRWNVWKYRAIEKGLEERFGMHPQNPDPFQSSEEAILVKLSVEEPSTVKILPASMTQLVVVTNWYVVTETTVAVPNPGFSLAMEPPSTNLPLPSPKTRPSRDG